MTFEPWHLMLIFTFLGTMVSGGMAAKLFGIAEGSNKSGSAVGFFVFGILVLLVAFVPCLLAWWFLFQRLVSSVLKLM